MFKTTQKDVSVLIDVTFANNVNCFIGVDVVNDVNIPKYFINDVILSNDTHF